MKQSILMIRSSRHIDALRENPLEEVYINSLPPRSRCLHGTSVDLFFEQTDFSITGEIVEDEHGIEGSALTFGATLGIEYWRKEIQLRSARPVIEAMELTSQWASLSYRRLLAGPREVRLYTNTPTEAQKTDTASLLMGLEMIAVGDGSQRVLFVASAKGSPGDVEILTPSVEYEVALANPNWFLETVGARE
jgi:hypothetical protein